MKITTFSKGRLQAKGLGPLGLKCREENMIGHFWAAASGSLWSYINPALAVIAAVQLVRVRHSYRPLSHSYGAIARNYPYP